MTSDAHEGDSIAVNGVCLTALNCVKIHSLPTFRGKLLNRSTLGSLQAGSRVNSERR